MNKVYFLVKKIPKGRLSTYKIIAQKLKIHLRKVARILSKNYKISDFKNFSKILKAHVRI